MLIKLDKYKLDEEAERLPSEFYDAAKNEEEATSDSDIFKVQLDSMREKVELEVRSMKAEQVNEKYGYSLDKLTEGTISAVVGQDKRVVELREKMNNAKRLAGTYRALRKGFDKKYGMIEVLSYLHNSGWFRGSGSVSTSPPKTKVPQAMVDKFNERNKNG